jgi:hypothetical protein
VPITFICTCGKKSLYQDEAAGHWARCAACGSKHVIPGTLGGDGKTAPAPAAVEPQPTPVTRVVLVGVDLSVLDLVSFLFKLVVAGLYVAFFCSLPFIALYGLAILMLR